MGAVDRVRERPVNWPREICERQPRNLPVIKSLAQNILSFIYIANDLPKICEKVPRFHKWTPYEKVLVKVKDIGTFLELPEKIYALKSIRNERSNWVRGQKIFSALQVTVEGCLMIPHEWNWIDLGTFSMSLGAVTFVKDALNPTCALAVIQLMMRFFGG